MIHVPKEKRDKWDSKSKEVIFIGYSNTVKGYRFLDLKTLKVITSRDAIFFENDKIEKEREAQSSQTKLKITNDAEAQENETHEDTVPQEDNEDEEPKDAESLESDEETEAEPKEKRPQQETQHRGQFRGEVPSRKPIVREGYISYYTAESTHNEPENVEEALSGIDKDNWLKAIQSEYKEPIRGNT